MRHVDTRVDMFVAAPSKQGHSILCARDDDALNTLHSSSRHHLSLLYASFLLILTPFIMKERLLRVAIVGAQKGRVQKVVSLMQTQDENIISLHDSASIRVQYLACVATFDSYQNEQGQNVRYLAKVEYCGDQPTSSISGSSSLSLAPFFDKDARTTTTTTRMIRCQHFQAFRQLPLDVVLKNLRMST